MVSPLNYAVNFSLLLYASLKQPSTSRRLAWRSEVPTWASDRTAGSREIEPSFSSTWCNWCKKKYIAEGSYCYSWLKASEEIHVILNKGPALEATLWIFPMKLASLTEPLHWSLLKFSWVWRDVFSPLLLIIDSTLLAQDKPFMCFLKSST